MSSKKLIIVESPAKVKTIKKFLGSGYDVAASGGHVRDLPKSSMGIDIENGFEPRYITIRGKGDVLAELRKKVKNASRVYLATDPDREGEAIAWHLMFALNLDPAHTSRISFNEITKKAVTEALRSPGKIDHDLVDAQQGRRIMDRLVGYSISPILWKKVKRGLSAGRVQSATLRMICDRERDISAFIPSEYWTVDASLDIEGVKGNTVFRYFGSGGAKTDIHDVSEAEAVSERLKRADLTVTDVRRGRRTKRSPLPFTTSTLQQEASKRLNFTTGKTMRIAQQLYEGVSLGSEGVVGVITYLRTDSTRVSDEAAAAVKGYIARNYGDSYVGAASSSPREGRNVQDAHEAIRPTDVERTPALVKDHLTRDQYRLYQLIWKRFTASAMADASFDTLTVSVSASVPGSSSGTGGAEMYDELRYSGRSMNFDGFLSVYDEDDSETAASDLKGIKKGSPAKIVSVDPEQHFTQPDPHYTEASLVKAMEEKGIGRPSTYAPTIMTLTSRYYVSKENKSLYVTELGSVVNDLMIKAFPDIADPDFTARMEEKLDDIAGGKAEWKEVIGEFYDDFRPELEKAEKELEKVEVKDEVSDEICEQCGRPMLIKIGRNGRFLACSGFPECRSTKPLLEKTGVKCPECGGDVLVKRTRKGRRYYGCEHNPECGYMVWRLPQERPSEGTN